MENLHLISRELLLFPKSAEINCTLSIYFLFVGDFEINNCIFYLYCWDGRANL